MFTQYCPASAPTHADSGAAQMIWQLPFVHVYPVGGHATLHAPQFWRSFDVLTQAAAPPSGTHARSPASHASTHWPPAQSYPDGHAFPHEPQLSGSVSVDVHDVPPPSVAGHLF